MAQRRMFSKTITNSSSFLMMSLSAQALYFHLGMNADDDGFCEHFSIMRMTDSKPDDLRILQAKGFVHVFDDRVLVIRAWKENNYIQKDRYTPSKYLEEYRNEIDKLSEGSIQDVYKVDTQVRLGKVRLGKDNKKETYKEKSLSVSKTSKNSLTPCTPDDLEEIATLMNIPLADVVQKHTRIMEMIEAKEFNTRKYKTIYYTLKSWLDLDKKKGYIRSSGGVVKV